MLSRLFIAAWERADLLALVGDVYCIFVTFPCGILGQVWYLTVSFPDLCLLSYLVKLFKTMPFIVNFFLKQEILFSYWYFCESVAA